MFNLFFTYAAIFIATGLFARFSKWNWPNWVFLGVCAIGALWTVFMFGVGIYNMCTQ